jgi:hypothetical protein
MKVLEARDLWQAISAMDAVAPRPRADRPRTPLTLV